MAHMLDTYREYFRAIREGYIQQESVSFSRIRLERYHYLGCHVPFGAHLRYWVRHRQRELACLLWTSPAWKMQARDAWIGWNDEQRQSNSHAF